jgi:hypothetical protein
LEIEYSAELLRQVQREGSGERRGVLYGRRRDSQVRLLAARRTGNCRDLRLAGLERVGVFVVRAEGEVFLTERDLEFAEGNGALQYTAPQRKAVAGASSPCEEATASCGAEIALVLAARRGGFFVRETDGTILAIRSHQEFSVPCPDSPKKTGIGRWLNAAAMTVCLVLAVAAALYAEPRAALTLSVREEAGQLIALWSPGVRGTLEIRDGERRLQVSISVLETRTTYEPESGDVSMVLTTLDGMTREEHIRIVDSPRRKTAASLLGEQIASLEAERDRLLAQSRTNEGRIARLERLAGR